MSTRRPTPRSSQYQECSERDSGGPLWPQGQFGFRRNSRRYSFKTDQLRNSARVSASARVLQIFLFRLAGRVWNHGARYALPAGHGLGVAREIVDGMGLRRARALQLGTLVEAPENHFACGGLMDRGHRD